MSKNRSRSTAMNVIAAILVIALLGACGDSGPTTTTVAEAPTTTPTTEPPTTSSAPATTATTSAPSTTATTIAEEEATLTPVETEEGLVRLFPVSAGWIVDANDDALTIGVSVGSVECYGLASAEVEETADEVLVTMSAGFRPDATGCGDVGPHWTYEFQLSEPLGDRPVVDTHTGLELGTEQPDPEEG